MCNHNNNSSITIPVQTVAVSDLPENTSELMTRAIEAARVAYAPYSQFRVGCAVRLQSGRVVTGSNQENAAYPSGLCAERTALFYAGANYPDDRVEELVVVAMRADGKLVKRSSPCGGCRQVMAEVAYRYDHPFRVVLPGPEEVLILEDCRQLLPITFDASDL